jgi:hypothetical protein
VAAQQPVAATGVPGDVTGLIDELPLPAVVAFRQQSSPMSVKLDSQSLGLGGSQAIRIASVGLGYRVITEHTATFTIANGVASVQTLPFGLAFPWILIANTSININGGATVYSADGYAGLLVAMRNRRGIFAASTLFSGGAGGVAGLPDSLVRFSAVGANLTLGVTQLATSTSGGLAPLCGFNNISVAASAATLNTFTVTWYTFEKLAFSRDSLLGALPLQNNSTFATLTRTIQSALYPSVTGGNSGVFTFNTNLTVTLTSYTNNSTYRFWSVPADPRLYAAMVSNSYQVLQAPGNTFSAVGVGAITYNVPQNNYLTALHLIAADSTSNFLVPLTGYLGRRLAYNAGSVIPVNEFMGRLAAEQFVDYGANALEIAGYMLWDGNDTAEDLNNTDQAGWLDAYATATPQFIVDIGAGVTTPASYSITRESVVSGAVNIVGG